MRPVAVTQAAPFRGWPAGRARCCPSAGPRGHGTRPGWSANRPTTTRAAATPAAGAGKQRTVILERMNGKEGLPGTPSGILPL